MKRLTMHGLWREGGRTAVLPSLASHELAATPRTGLSRVSGRSSASLLWRPNPSSVASSLLPPRSAQQLPGRSCCSAQMSTWMKRPQWAGNLRQVRRRAEETPGSQQAAAGRTEASQPGPGPATQPASGSGTASQQGSQAAGSTHVPPPPKKTPVTPITWKSALLALGACGVVLAYFEIEKAKRKPKIEIAVVGTPSIGGPFTLVDQNGRIVTNHTYHGRYMLLYFGFTFCPDICPAELAKVTKAISILEEQEGITPGLVVPVFISVDPYRDTVAKIRTYLKDFHPSFVGLTGTPQQVESMARAYRVYSATSQHSEEDEDYLVDHSIFLYLMDKEGNFLSHHGSQYDAQELAKRIANDVRSKGDCPPSPWIQLKEKANNLLGSLIH